MNEMEMLQQAVETITKYAQFRKNDVAKGLETPRLAGLLVQKFGEGMIAMLRQVTNNHDMVSSFSTTVDTLVSEIDPYWIEHAKSRWAARPADLSL